MKNFNVKSTILAYAGIAFILIGVLFGMNIVTFIFGNLGPTQAGFAVGTAGYNTSLNIQNNSLAAINTYASAAPSQMSTISIVIIIALLVSLFALFMAIFTGKSGGSRRSSYSGSGSFE